MRRLLACCVVLLTLIAPHFAAETGSPPPVLTREESQQLAAAAAESIAAARAQRPPVIEIPAGSPLQRRKNGVHLLLLRQGEVLAEAMVQQATLLGNLRVAAAKAAAGIDESSGDDVWILLTVFEAPQPVPVGPVIPIRFSRSAILGVHGISAEYRGLRTFLPPLHPLVRGWNWKDMLQEAVEALSPPPEESEDEKHAKSLRVKRVVELLARGSVRFELVPGTVIARAPGGTVHRLYRMSRSLPISAVTPETVDTALVRLREWYLANRAENGAYPGRIDPLHSSVQETAAIPEASLNAMAVAALSRYLGDPQVQQSAVNLMVHLLQSYSVIDGERNTAYLREPRQPAPLEATAAAMLAILKLGALEVEENEFRERSERMRNFCLMLRRNDGSYQATYPAEESNQTNAVAPGLTQLALATYAQASNDDRLMNAVMGSMRYYHSAWQRTQRYRAMPLQIEACRILYEQTRQREAAEFALKMARLLVTTQQRASHAGLSLPDDERGRCSDPDAASEPDTVAVTARHLAGLADAYTMARQLGETKLAEQLRDTLLWGTRALLQLQYAEETDLLLVRTPAHARGAFRTSPSDFTIRLENQALVTLALIKIRTALQDEDWARVEVLAQTR